jgi:hypothetical protein
MQAHLPSNMNLRLLISVIGKTREMRYFITSTMRSNLIQCSCSCSCLVVPVPRLSHSTHHAHSHKENPKKHMYKENRCHSFLIIHHEFRYFHRARRLVRPLPNMSPFLQNVPIVCMPAMKAKSRQDQASFITMETEKAKTQV